MQGTGRAAAGAGRRSSSAADAGEAAAGLLAESVPAGRAYAGVRGESRAEAIVAADRRRPRTAGVDRPGGDVAERAQALLTRRALVVAGLPRGQRVTWRSTN